MRLHARAVLVTLCFVLLLTGCGAVRAGVDYMRSQVDDAIRNDMAAHPYLACTFDAPAADLVRAVRDAFTEHGYDIYDVDMQRQEVETAPISSRPVGDRYELEAFEGIVYELDGEEAVWLRYMRGPSASDQRWAEEPGFRPGDRESYYGERVHLKTERYYRGLMPAIAESVGEEPCT